MALLLITQTAVGNYTTTMVNMIGLVSSYNQIHYCQLDESVSSIP